VNFRDPQRRPEIHVAATQEDGLWRFAVTDNGIGIRPEYTERVFAIFQRLHTRDAYPGNGIGLALCRKIVEFHGGGIELIECLEQITVAERPRPEFFATCTVVSIDPVRRTASVVLAGHHEPLLLGPGGPQLLPAAYGVALGLGSGRRRWTETGLDLPDAGALLLYTDGLSEGHTGMGTQRLGVEGLRELIAAAPQAGAEALLDHLVSAAQRLDSGRHSDDMAILHLDFTRRD